MAARDALELADSMPQAAPLQPVPDKAQFTPLFCASFCTVAVKLWVAPVGTLAAAGDRLTETGVGELLPLDETLTPAHPEISTRANTHTGMRTSFVVRTAEIAMTGALLSVSLGGTPNCERLPRTRSGSYVKGTSSSRREETLD